MVEMDEYNKLKPFHDKLNELTGILNHVIHELVKLREELHTIDGLQMTLPVIPIDIASEFTTEDDW